MTEADDDFDLYDVLNLQRDASTDDVRAAFHNMSRIYHPDKNTSSSGTGSDSAGGKTAFLQILRAYRILNDETLREFYNRYGLLGVRLAEDVEEEKGEDMGKQIIGPEDRLKDLETRVNQLLQKHHELRTQRLLALQGMFTLSTLALPGPHGAHLQRRYRLQYSAMSQSVQVNICDMFRLVVGCSAHVQGGRGFGVAPLLLAVSSNFDSQTNMRAAVRVTGASPTLDLSMVRSLTNHCTVQQKASISSDGATMSFAVHPRLTRTLRGSVGFTCGDEAEFTVGLVKQNASSSDKARVSLSLQPQAGEVGINLKYKPHKSFALRLAPAVSLRGWTIQTTCTQHFPDGLTKLHWGLRLRRRNALLKFTLCRSGLQFSFPMELWPEAAGPLPLGELGFALLLWTAPPLVIHMLRILGQRISHALQDSSAANTAMSKPAPVHDHAAMAQEQRQLIVHEAVCRRDVEASRHGLVILSARYGDSKHVLENAATFAGDVIDVTDCLMAKVRQSQLYISGHSKATLVGFYNPCQKQVDSKPVLYIRYRYGQIEYVRIFGDIEAVLLP